MKCLTNIDFIFEKSLFFVNVLIKKMHKIILEMDKILWIKKLLKIFPKYLTAIKCMPTILYMTKIYS